MGDYFNYHQAFNTVNKSILKVKTIHLISS